METIKYTIKTTRNQNSKLKGIDWDNIPFGLLFSDHMLMMDYRDGEWKEPEIVPFGDIPLHPATSAIHYGQAIFEGIKAYRTDEGKPVMFRPDQNASRFRKSAYRMCMPEIPEDLFLFCLDELLSVDQQWIGPKPINSLYIRPFMFATAQRTGIRPSDTYKFVIHTCPVGAYYTQPVSVKIVEEYSRTAQGGVGLTKAAGNYGGAMYPTELVKKQGFGEVLWTDSSTHSHVEEAGTMNILFIENGKVITPTEEFGTILAGITKHSLLELAKDMGLETEERVITVKEVVNGIKNGDITEAFGAGTAATVAPINMIGYRDEKLFLPEINENSISAKLAKLMDDYKHERVVDKFGWLRKVN